MCKSIGLKHPTTTVYHPHTNGRAEKLNRTLIARLRHYTAEHQRDWDIFMQPLTYAYNRQVSRSIGTTPFGIVLLRHPPGQTTLDRSSALQTSANNANAPAVLRSRLLHSNAEMRQKMDKKLRAAQSRCKDHHDCRIHATKTFRPEH